MAETDSGSVSHLKVNLVDQYRPVTQVASGSLYGLAKEGWPIDDLIGPTKPKMFTQMAPGGTHFPNGEKEVVGDALEVAPIAERHGAKITIRMPDIYPTFPYEWVGEDDWYDKVDSIVEDTLASGVSNIYGYEIWNEPDWTWNSAVAGDFKEVWKATYHRIRAKDPHTPIIGPSTTHWNRSYIEDFLIFARDNDVLPDIISWHELGNPEGNHVNDPAPWAIEKHIREYRELEEQLGIEPRPISINEYGVQTEEGVPGNMVQYFAQFERGGVDTANAAFWYRPGRLSNIITDSSEANGGWCLYKWYGDMSGSMVMTTPDSTTSLGLDGIASIDADEEVVHVIFGGNNETAHINISGFDEVSFFDKTVHVKVEATPWYGVDTPVTEPYRVYEGNFDIQDNQITIPVTQMHESWGYRLTVTPSGSSLNRYEAEHATIHQGQTFNSEHASNEKYVGDLAQKGSFVEYEVAVEESGDYQFEIAYANGSGMEQTQTMIINDSDRTTLQFPSTDGWTDDIRPEILSQIIYLEKGRNTIKFATDQANTMVEHDYIQLMKALEVFEGIWEAEDAVVHRATVHHSGYASNGKYVGNIDFPDSYVEFNVEVPHAGEYVMEIGYANGTQNESSHALMINDHFMTHVTYPVTGGWLNSVPNFGTRQLLDLEVELEAGNNNITFNFHDSYAELDYIKLRPINDQTPDEDIDINDLIALTELFVQENGGNKGELNSLIAKLEAAKASEERGNIKARNGQLKAFENQVRAKTGKLFTESQAAIFIDHIHFMINNK